MVTAEEVTVIMTGREAVAHSAVAVFFLDSVMSVAARYGQQAQPWRE